MSAPALRMVALDLGPVSFGPTPLAILISGLLVAAVLLVVFLLGSQIGGALVDKRWPANQPLTPSEVLWGESGSYVKKTFPGLDPSIARDLSQYISTRKVPAGTALVEEGDLPTRFMLLKSGAAEVDGGKALKAGDSLGGDNIISRTPHAATVRTTAPTEVVSLGAEDYLAAMALGMSDDDDDFVVKALGAYFDDDAATATSARSGGGSTATIAPPASAAAGAPPRAAAAPPATPPAASPAPAAPPAASPTPSSPTSPPAAFAAPTAAAPQRPPVARPAGAAPVAPGAPWAAATHRVTAPELPGYVLPAGDRPTRTLVAGTLVEAVESLPGWVHVRTADGWQGWIAEHGLNRL
ncbi:MAG: cyclic nucleotide-binding domain-containing protein [Ilumatobacteraceae bacterium]